MQLCDDGHAEVVYDERRDHCPACEALAEALALRDQLGAAEDTLDEVRAELKAAQEAE